MMAALTQRALDFLRDAPVFAPALIFAVAFGESFAIVSLFVPGTVLLFAAGALVVTGGLPAMPMLVAASLGAIAGDGISYWLGHHYADAIERALPRYRPLILRGVAFFARFGDASIVIGRFFGPARAFVPLAAGILRMPPWRFWIANVGSAALWAPVVLFSGAAFGRVAQIVFEADAADALLVFVLVTVAAAIGFRVWRAGVKR